MCFLNLCCFNVLLRLFSSNRRCLAAYGTSLLFRIGRVFRASASNCCNLSTAALRFALCVLYFCDITLSTPFLSVRLAREVSIRCFCKSERLSQLVTSKNSVTRVLSLLIFCPPGPLLRETLNTSSSSFINMSPGISIITVYFNPIRFPMPCQPT